MKIKYSKKFEKCLNKVPLHIKKAFVGRLRLFQHDRYHPRLNYHRLKGEYRDYWSINVTGDWRALFEEEDGIVKFHLFGTHSELYG